MNVIPQLKEFNPKSFIIDYLTANNVKDIERYLNPDDSCFDDPNNYPNMSEAVEYLYNHITGNSKVGILIDCDGDGNFSAAILYDFLKNTLKHEQIELFIHTGKQHGLRQSKDEDIVEQVIASKINLLFLPDSGTNDKDECGMLKDFDVDIVILDHHEANIENPNAIIVNHHLGEGLNTALSGAGVTSKFIEAYCSRYNISCPDYSTMVACSIISDVCDLSLENRAYLNKGLGSSFEYANDFLTLLFEKAVTKGRNSEGVSWGIAPLINATTRSSDQDAKLVVFQSLVGEKDPSEGLKIARRCHREQTNTVKEIMEEIESTVDNTHVVVVGYSKVEYAAYTGLVANKLMSKYNKPVFVLREMNSTTWSGSLRSPVDLADVINKSGFGKAQGHESAAGLFIQKGQLNRLLKYLDDNLDLSITPDIPVTAEIKPKQITTDLCKMIVDNAILWGHGLPCPTWHVKAKINQSHVQFFQKRTTTAKLTVDGIDFIKFQATQDEIEKLSKTEFNIEMICELGLNEWNGVVSPQAIIKQFEVSNVEEKPSESWEDLF